MGYEEEIDGDYFLVLDEWVHECYTDWASGFYREHYKENNYGELNYG